MKLINSKSVLELLQVQNGVLVSSPMRSQHIVHVVFLRSGLTCTVTNGFGLSTAIAGRGGRRGVRSFLLLATCTAFQAPELSDSAQLPAQHHFILVNKRAHIGLETAWCIDRAHAKAQLDIVFGISSDDEVDIAPVCKQPPLDVADNIGQVLLVYCLSCLVCQRVTEVAIQLLGVGDPAGAQDLKGIGLIRIVLAEVTNVALLLILGPHIAPERILMLMLTALYGHGAEWHLVVQSLLLRLASFPLIRQLLPEVLERVFMIVELLEETPTVLKFDVATLLHLVV